MRRGIKNTKQENNPLMNANNPTNTVKSLELFYSRPLVIVATLLVGYFVCFPLYWLILMMSSGHVFGLVLGVLGLLFGLPLLIPFVMVMLHAWRHQGPVVILSVEGVTDYRKKRSFVPWTDVKLIRLGIGETASFLCFVLQRSALDMEDAPRIFFGLGRILKCLDGLGDWNISLRMLRCNKRDVLAQARKFYHLGIRQQVVEMNKDQASGWSGTL
jgi:hypothetical protein